MSLSRALTLMWCEGYFCVNLAGLRRLVVWADTSVDVSIKVSFFSFIFISIYSLYRGDSLYQFP
jgi:hypothetical protein